jgi:Ca2+-binding EF-hand superfamily protein
MRRTVLFLSLLALTPLASTAQVSQDSKSRMVNEIKQRFDKADTNGDGALDREEAKAMPRIAHHFDDIDTDHDGKVTLQEIGRYLAAKRDSK